MPRTNKPQQESAADGERVQKVLARAGLASRRQAEEWIRDGRVTINGERAELGSRARGSDQIRLDGRLIHQAPARRTATWMCHRSPGENLVTPAGDEGAAEDGRAAVSERLSRRVGRRYIPVSPMPRMDGGLELLTSSGEFASQLQRAVRNLPMEFSVRVRGELAPAQLQGVLAGLLQDGTKVRIEECEPTGGEASNRWYKLTAIGTNGRDVRLLFEEQGATVSRVLRVAMGGLSLERTLGRGKARQLSEAETAGLLDHEPEATGSPAPDR